VRGNAGVGKTSNLMKLFVENNYTIYYINASNILFGRYESTNVVSTLYELWLNIAAAARKNKKVIIIIDECESVIKNTEDKVVNLPNGLLEHELSKNRNTLEKALTNFIKYICAQGIAPTIFIGNDCYDEKGQLNIDNSMCRRFNYIWNMSLPSLKTLVNIWSKYLKIYKVTISDHEQEEAAFYLGKYCQENKISIRTIVQITAVLKNSSISVKDLCVLIS
jgi:SpoVK/Ycf46/Vps4 family AAA+-type ATPase